MSPPVGAVRAGVIGASTGAFPDSGNLQHRWPTDEGSGTTVYDDVGNNDGSFSGSPAWTSGVGKGGWHLDYDATNDYVTYGNIWDSPSSLTISVWADTWAADSYRTVIQQPVNGRSVGGAHIGTDGKNGNLRFAFSGTVKDTEPTPSGWNMATISWDGSTCKMYLNNVEIHSFSAGVPSWDTNDILSTGARPDGSEKWDGGVDDPKIWASSLTSTQVSELYNFTEGYY